MPAAVGLTDKTFANLKSDFLAAVRASGIKSVPRAAKTRLTATWSALMAELSSKRMHLGLLRFAGWCSDKGIEPMQVRDAALADFVELGQAGDAASKAERIATKSPPHLERSRTGLSGRSPAALDAARHRHNVALVYLCLGDAITLTAFRGLTGKFGD